MCSPEKQTPAQMGSEQATYKKMGPEKMAPGQINLKGMCPEQMGFEQISPTKINASRNKFCTQCLKSPISILSPNTCNAINRLNY